MHFDQELSENNPSVSSAEAVASAVEAAAHTAASDEPPAPAEAEAPKAASADSAAAKIEEKTAAPAPSPKSDAAPQEPKTAPAVSAVGERPRSSLIPFIPAQRADAPAPGGGEFMRAAFEKRFQLGAVAAGVALVGVLAVASISYKSQQEQYLVSQSAETQNLAETVKALKARIGALEASKRDEVSDLRKTVADIKGGLAALRDSGSTNAQLSARYDHAEHDQEARIEKLSERVDHDAATHYADLTTKLEKLSERVDRDATARIADFAGRLEKLEKKAAAPVMASVVPAPPTPPVAPPKPTSSLATPPLPPGVSRETTGSIPTPQKLIRGWFVREVHGGMAVVQGPDGFREVGPGDFLPGAGRVERVERHGRDWTVVTNQGYFNDGGSGMGSPGMGPVGGVVGGDF